MLPLINLDVPTLRVQAGPGTGKTFGLRLRVLRLLHPDGLGLDPGRVLVCTFNRAIAADLASEIDEELARYALKRPPVKTVHRLAMELLGESGRFLLDHEIEAMVYDIRCKHPDLNEKYERKQRLAMRALREHEAGLKDHTALSQAAHHWLAAHAAQLVGDVPRRAERRLAQGDLETKRYSHIIVDEFQDLTEGEARLLLRLRREGASFVALGDRKQSIYAFRGNAERGLAALPDLVDGGVTDHSMDECQRCYKEVVDLSNAVMALENEPLRPVRGPGGQVHIVHFKTPDDETRTMAKEIVRVYRATPDDKHLVLVTRRKWGYSLRTAIRSEDPNIDVQTVYGEDILETWPAREAFLLLSILGDPTDAVSIRSWVGYATVPDGRKFKAAERNGPAYCNLWAERGVLSLQKAMELADQPETEFAGSGRRGLLERLGRLRDLSQTVDIALPTEQVIRLVLSPDRWITFKNDLSDLARADLERLQIEALRLVNELEEPTLYNVVVALRSRIATREPLGLEGAPDIRIVTLWGAKGLTADYVYLLGLVDEALPGPYDAESTGLSEADHLDEQRRLLYVSLTRSKNALVVSRPQMIRIGQIPALGLQMPRRKNRFWAYLSPCRFFEDLDQALLPESIPGTEWGGIRV